MPRSTQFDKEAVLESAMQVFWQNGIENTSINTLVEATGLKRSSLYNTFDNKEGLFKACFTRYLHTVMGRMFDPFRQDCANIDTVIQHFEQLSKALDGDTPRRGCLLMNTAAASINEANIVDTEVTQAFVTMEQHFYCALRYSQTQGEISLKVDTKEQAKLLVAENISVGNLVRTTGGKYVGRSFIKHVISRLRTLKI